MFFIMYPRLSRVMAMITAGLLGVGCFFTSINGSFVFDDTEAILNNKDILLDTPVWQLFKNDFWGTHLTSNTSHKSYRPLAVLSFRLNVFLNNGTLDAFGFHLFNLILHGIVCSLTFPVFLTIFKGENAFHNGFLSSLLFSVHPIHSEAVAGIVGRADLLCAVFSILAYLMFTQAVECKTLSGAIILSVVSAMLAACAMFSKEQGITILGVCCVFDLCMSGLGLSQLLSLARQLRKLPSASWPVRFIVRQLILCTCGLTMLYLRCYLMNFETPSFQPVDNPASFADSLFTRVINYNYIYLLNFWLLLCPQWLCFDWSMGCVPLISLTKQDIRVILVFFLWAFTSVFISMVFFTSRKKMRVPLMGCAFLVLPFFVASNLLFRVGFVIAERVLYLPSIGFCILVSYGFQKLCVRSKYKSTLHVCYLLLMAVNVMRCMDRCKDWLTERSLFESGLHVCPLNAKVHYNMAKTSNSTAEAISYYRKALELHPDYEQAMNNLANILRDLGNTSEAENLLRKAVSIRREFPAAWMNLGIVLSQVGGRFEESLTAYTTALSYRAHYPDCYYNLGNLYLSQKMYSEAYQSWRKATSQKKGHSVAWNNMIVMLDSLGEHERAERIGREALRHLPGDSSLHFNLGNTLGKQGQFSEAEKCFLTAISLRPAQPLYHTNLGVLYHRWKRYQEAYEQYSKALELNPDSNNAYQNLKIVKKFL